MDWECFCSTCPFGKCQPESLIRCTGFIFCWLWTCQTEMANYGSSLTARQTFQWLFRSIRLRNECSRVGFDSKWMIVNVSSYDILKLHARYLLVHRSCWVHWWYWMILAYWCAFYFQRVHSVALITLLLQMLSWSVLCMVHSDRLL